jgi:integrase-like protein
LIGYPELKPHDLRHGVAVEVLEQRHDLEEVRALLGHARIDTTQIYTKISPAAAQARGGVLRGRGRAAAGRRSGGADAKSFEDGRSGFEESRWWLQRDSNPCFSLERAVSQPAVTRTYGAIATRGCYGALEWTSVSLSSLHAGRY